MLDVILSQIETEEEKTLIEELYMEYEAQMYGTAYAILRHRQDAEDAVEGAFLKVIEHLPTLNLALNRQTRALLLVITRNIAYNELKKRNLRLKHESDIVDTEEISVTEDLEKLDFKDIQKLIETLPCDLKNVIIMRFMLDYSAEQTAELLDISTSAVYKRTAAARKLLKINAEDYYG